MMRMGEGRQLRRLARIARIAGGLESAYEEMSDGELRALTADFRQRRQDGESFDSLMPEAFAAVREASRRTLGLRHFDVQLMGGAVLHWGGIAEMKTGEGKTLVATLPVYLNALDGLGVHIVTVNDYLARYQSELMGRVFRFLGLETGCILTGMDPQERRKQYAADVTYGTNNEFGFDYLRDNMAMSMGELVQRGHVYAIVDEVDSILIDEARTPLIISGPAQGVNNRWYGEFAALVRTLKAGDDYEVDEKKRTVGILEAGVDKVEKALGLENLYSAENTPLIAFLSNALKAKELFKRDKEYVVLNGEVDIVDEHTGRLLKGRRYSDGLHQALEAKEGVPIKAENQTFASITLQNYFRLYTKLAGMTGTAQTEAAELNGTYGMNVLPIPTNLPMIRIDQPDFLYKNEQAKYDAVVEDIVERHEAGQPVLVGTTSVEKSEKLSKELKKHGIAHEVLNAKEHEREASIVAEAGRKGAVTVATNMAGRGTDIMLGGNPEFRAVGVMAKKGFDPHEDPATYEANWASVFAAEKKAVAKEHDEVVAAGGLYVLGTERHESRRIDNQLRGRSGRQGDPGESRFYLSLEDELMRLFQTGLASAMMNSSAFPDDMPIESKVLTRGVRSAQAQIEGRNHEARKAILKYDDVMSVQRKVIYAERRRILEGEDLAEQMRSFINDVIEDRVSEVASTGNTDDWDVPGLIKDLLQVYPVSLTADEILDDVGGQVGLTYAGLLREFQSDAQLRYTDVENRIGPDVMRQVERQVVLQVLDNKWRDHLYEMDYLREGIGLRSMGQRDPLMEYQREGAQMFDSVSDGIKEQSVQVLFRVERRDPNEAQGQPPAGVPGQPAPINAESAAATAAAPAGQAAAAPQAASGQVASGPQAGAAFGVGRRIPMGPSSTTGGPGGVQVSQMTYSGPTLDTASGKTEAKKTKTTPAASGLEFPGTPRNAPCPCGSGKKYKLCHGKDAS
jgi:preprotein translocase subunit SecA